MQLNQDQGSGTYHIRAYEPGKITVNSKQLSHSLLIAPERLLEHWAPTSLTELTMEHLDEVLEFQPQIIILGTGTRLVFPPPKLQAHILQKKIGLEIMDTRAACRTYSLLMAEQRNVVAALLIK